MAEEMGGGWKPGPLVQPCPLRPFSSPCAGSLGEGGSASHGRGSGIAPAGPGKYSLAAALQHKPSESSAPIVTRPVAGFSRLQRKRSLLLALPASCSLRSLSWGRVN